jgi:hypothetical protein
VLSRGLLCAERDDHATGRPLVYRPTPRLLQVLGAETLEDARGRLGASANYTTGQSLLEGTRLGPRSGDRTGLSVRGCSSDGTESMRTASD